MAVGYYTTDTLIEAVKRKAMLPTNQSTFKTADFLAFANEELKSGILPSVISLHEEYYVYPEVMTLQANKSSYGIPYRAIGGRLRDLYYKDNNGNLIQMSKINPDDKELYQRGNTNSNFIFYYIQGNNVVITPAIGDSPSGELLFTYYIRPSDLVSENRVAEISGIATDSAAGTTTYTVDLIPTGMSTNTKLDLLQAKPGHKIRNIDLTAVAINTTNKTITFNTADIDSDTEEGDNIAFAGECMIPQCPADLHPILAQRVAARCLEALGDTQGLTNANTKLQELEMKTIPLVDNRVEGSPQKVFNKGSMLRNSGRRRRW